MYDLELDLMTFIFDFGIDILKLCLRTKNKVSKSRLSKVRPQIRQTDTQTHTQTDRQTDQTHYHAAFAAGKIKSISAEARECGVPREADGTDRQSTPKHVDDLHWQVKTTGRLVETDTKVGRR